MRFLGRSAEMSLAERETDEIIKQVRLRWRTLLDVSRVFILADHTFGTTRTIKNLTGTGTEQILRNSVEILAREVRT